MTGSNAEVPDPPDPERTPAEAGEGRGATSGFTPESAAPAPARDSLPGRLGRFRDRVAEMPDPMPADPGSRVPWRTLFAVVFAVSLATHLYGSAAPPFWGHYGFHTGEYGLRARNCLRHDICTDQSQAVGSKKPQPGSFYHHHPPFWVPFMAASTATFGDRPVVIRVTGILATMLALFAVFSTLRRFWDPAKGLAGAILFALLPQVLMFGTLPHTEQPALALGIIALALFLRFFETQRLRQALAAVVCVFLAGQTDWIVYITFVLAAGVWFFQALARWWRSRRAADPAAGAADLSRATLEGLAAAALAALTLLLVVLHVVKTYKAGTLVDLAHSLMSRTTGPPDRWEYYRAMWKFAQDNFTQPGMFVILASIAYGAAKVAVRRFRRRTRPADVVPWLLLLSFTLYLVLFESGMIIHQYRWWFLAGAAAFFLADFLVDMGRLLRAQVVDRIPRVPARRWVRAFAAVLPCAALAAHLAVGAPHVLAFSRKTGGTNFPSYDSIYPQLMAMQAIRDRTRLGDVVHIHDDLGVRHEMLYTLDRDVVFGRAINAAGPPANVDFAVFSSHSARVDHKAMLAKYKVEIFGHFLLVHFHRKGPDLTVYGLEAEDPDALWWFWVSSFYPPVRWVDSGPVRARQVLAFHGVPASGPTWGSEADPRFAQYAFEQVLLHGDQAAADAHLESLRRAFPGQPNAMLTPEIELLGYVFHRDTQTFDVYFYVHRAVPHADWGFFLHGYLATDGRFLDLGGAVLDWKPNSVIRAERTVWTQGVVDLHIGLWRPDIYAPRKTGDKAGIPMGRLDLGTQYKF